MNYDKEIAKFVKTNPDYYIEQFQRIGNSSKTVISFNFFAAILGPVWFGARSLWNYAWVFLILETFSIVQIVRGFLEMFPLQPMKKLQELREQLFLENNN